MDMNKRKEQQPMPNFPILDAPRNEPGRVVTDSFGSIEPRIEETDWWCQMPVRLAHNQGAGWCIEVGPYELDRRDIERLRKAITAYDQATGPTT